MLTGQKDSSIFDILSSKPYKSVMANNVDLDLSFDYDERSIQKTLAQPKRAFFSFEANVDPKYKCMVWTQNYKIQLKHSLLFYHLNQFFPVKCCMEKPKIWIICFNDNEEKFSIYQIFF